MDAQKKIIQITSSTKVIRKSMLGTFQRTIYKLFWIKLFWNWLGIIGSSTLSPFKCQLTISSSFEIFLT